MIVLEGLQTLQERIRDAMTIMSDTDQLAGMTPDTEINVKKVFGLDTDMKVTGFSKRTEYVPELDESYLFDPQTLSLIHI